MSMHVRYQEVQATTLIEVSAVIAIQIINFDFFFVLVLFLQSMLI